LVAVAGLEGLWIGGGGEEDKDIHRQKEEDIQESVIE